MVSEWHLLPSGLALSSKGRKVDRDKDTTRIQRLEHWTPHLSEAKRVCGSEICLEIEEGGMPLNSCHLPNDPEDPSRTRSALQFGVNHRLPWPLALCLALQQLLVQSSLLVLVVGLLQEPLRLQVEEEKRLLASGFFHSGVSSLLQGWLGTRLPLLQTSSLEFVVPALVLTYRPPMRMCHNRTEAVCRGPCVTGDHSFTQADPLRELQGMVLTSGLVLLVLGASGLSGPILKRSGPLVLAPLLCVLGFSIYREAAVLCSEHWGIATLAVLLMVFLSQHLHSWALPSMLVAARYPFFRMISVLLPMLSIWGLCTALEHLGYFHPRSSSELLSTLHSRNTTSFIWASLSTSSTLDWISLNTSTVPLWIAHNRSHTAPWFSFPLTGLMKLPLLSTRSIGAGVAAALSSFISSLAVYVLTARLLRTSSPPPHACNRGLCAEGLGAVSAALLGGPLGVSSSLPNACTLGLSQCGCRRSVQLAAMMGLILGLSPRLTQLLTSFPLGIYGAVLSVTYTIAAGTGVTYFQYTHMDSGRNIFNIGFAVFMSLLLPRWFNLHPSFISTGVSILDVLLQSLMTLPVFLVGLLAFFLDNTVSGRSLSERGLSSTALRKRALDDQVSECSQDPFRIYNLPDAVQRLLDLPGIRVVPFCFCRTQNSKDTNRASQETSDLMNGVVENRGQDL
ncbi:solute carrier family 23 member 3 isoform X2 [Arapaima gigas]